MEINKFSDIIGVVTTEAITEGRFVLLTDHSQSYDYGSRQDLPGVKLPENSTEAARANYVLAFQVDNRQIPIYEQIPSFGDDGALRYGWDKAENVSFNADVHLTPQGNKLGEILPSGVLGRAFGGGVFTLTSSEFIASANWGVGAFVVAANVDDDTAAEAGKAKHSATETGSVAIVERYNSDDGLLTIRTLQP